MLSDEDLYTHHYPKNPLPFNIVGESCKICANALKEFNKYIPYSAFYDTVKITLHKDSAGRGWHIQGYQIGESKPVDLSDVPFSMTVQKEEGYIND